MKIKNLKKFIRGILLIFLTIIVVSLFVNRSSYSYSNKKYITIYVGSGDTLWSIASNLQNTDYYKGKDVRFVINDIKSTNNLTNSNLSIGDELKIPVI